MGDPLEVFGGRLRNLRETASLTQTDLGNLLGSGKVQVSRYETGGVLPNAATLVRIADYFNCSVDYLLGRTDKITGEGREKDKVSPEERFIVEALREKRYSRLMNMLAMRFAADEELAARQQGEHERVKLEAEIRAEYEKHFPDPGDEMGRLSTYYDL